jgi:hypothetical protein
MPFANTIKALEQYSAVLFCQISGFFKTDKPRATQTHIMSFAINDQTEHPLSGAYILYD